MSQQTAYQRAKAASRVLSYEPRTHEQIEPGRLVPLRDHIIAKRERMRKQGKMREPGAFDALRQREARARWRDMFRLAYVTHEITDPGFHHPWGHA